jgi:hypothetical protein
LISWVCNLGKPVDVRNPSKLDGYFRLFLQGGKRCGRWRPKYGEGVFNPFDQSINKPNPTTQTHVDLAQSRKDAKEEV